MKYLLRLSNAFLFALAFILLPHLAFAQKKAPNAAAPELSATVLKQRLAYSVQRFADSTLQSDRLYSDSLVAAAALIAEKAAVRLDRLADSLITSAEDSLDASRKDTLRSVTKSLQQQIRSDL